MKFNEKLHDLRKRSNMTQTALAEKLNVSRQAVSRWEQGSAMPDIENLIAMSDLFGVTLDELLKDHAPQAQSTEAEADESSRDDADIALDRLVNWLRADVFSAAIGIASIINGAFYGYLFDRKLAVFNWVGIALLAFSAVLTVILFFAFRAFKKKYD